MKKIVFPFKIGVDNNAGFCLAARLARRTKSTLILLNAFEVEIEDNIDTTEYRKKLRNGWIRASQEVMRMQHHYLDTFAKITDNFHIKHEYKFVHSKTSIELNKIINNENEDIIAIVLTIPKEKSKINEIKNISFDIIDKKNLPIIIVPEGAALKTINNIVFSTNFNKLKNANKYLDIANRLADLFKANLHFVHICNDIKPKEIKDKLIMDRINKLTTINSNYKFKFLYGNSVLDILEKYVKNNSVDMIYTIGKERGYFERLIGIEKGESIFLRSKIPVWIENS